MKITRVESIVLNLPMAMDGATPALGGRARTSIDMLLVRVDTDEDVTGWGEAFGHRIDPATRAALDTLLGPMGLGRDGRPARPIAPGRLYCDFAENPLGDATHPRDRRIAVPQGPGVGRRAR